VPTVLTATDKCQNTPHQETWLKPEAAQRRTLDGGEYPAPICDIERQRYCYMNWLGNTPVDLLIVLILLAATVVMFAINRPRMDAAALIMMTILPFTGIITVGESLLGLSDPNIVMIAALFVIGEGLVRTGVAQRLGDLVIRHAGRNETSLIIVLMITVAGIGSVMSSTGAVAIFIPIVLRIAHSAGIAPGRLMMPLSVAALISGMMTLVATPPNLVVHGELVRRGYEGFSFFAFAPFGIPVLGLAILYMLFARRWLASSEKAEDAAQLRPHWQQWVDEYALAGRAHRLRIAPDSSLVGQTLEQLDLRSTSGVNIVAIERRTRFSREMIRPLAETRLASGDVLFLDISSPDVNVEELCRRFSLMREIGMAELMVPTGSSLIGKSAVESRFRTEYDLAVIGIKRGQSAFEGNIPQEHLKLGDTLLVVGPWRAIRKLQANPRDLFVLHLPTELDDIVPAPNRALHALLVLALVVGLMVSGVIPNVQAVLIGCLLMGLFGCVDMNSSYRSIHWQSLFLIVGMMPFSLALQRTGGLDLAAGALLETVGQADPRFMLAAIFVLTAVFGLFISNTATAILVAPLALAIADALGASPYPFAMTVALAASTAFMTPVSSPVNTLVVGPGKYHFLDFVRIGVPFALVVMVLTVVMVPIVLPF
jgi:di/tricarboxylate transporter